MREILFRGKRLDNGEWVYGTPIFYSQGTVVMCREFLRNENVNPETVGQYTECKDRMGERIFEGDILAFNPGDGEETSHYLVKWDNARWTVCTGRGYADDEMIDWESEYWTVIGNIYDNPELLGGAE